MIENVSDYRFPQKPRLYNSERREVTGCIEWNNNDTSFYPGIGTDNVGGEDNNVQEFHLNASNTSESNPKTVTLFTYANGVTVKMDYYLREETDTTINIANSINYYDKNGNRITSIGTFSAGLTSTKEYGATVSNVPIWFSPCGVYYGNVSSGLEGVSYEDIIIFYQRSSGSPYDPINLNGAYNTQERFNYYGKSANILSELEWNDFWEAVIDGGDGTPISPILPSDDTSEPGGGDDANPDYNPFSDPIAFPGLPTGGSAIATGFIRVYTPTASQLQSLAGVLWSDSFIDTIKKIQNDPMEAIISLHSLPMSLSSGTAECRIGNFNTGITMNTVSSQYVKRDLGSLAIPEHWASALDYGPYNTVDIYLPYVGVRSLQIDDVVGKILRVEYNVDILSGATVASVMCGNSVLYTYNTSLIAYHPISQSSFGPLYQSIAGAMGNVISGAVSGGIGGAVGGGLGSAINVALSKHSTVSRGGTIGANSGCLGNFVPYLIIHRPIQSLASGFAHFKGYPSNITATLGSVSGYTEVESVHLNGITCTDNEKAEIEALLYNGVIL